MKDLQKWEVESLIEGLDSLENHSGLSEQQHELRTRLYDRMAEIEELENMDLGDCAGGACKL